MAAITPLILRLKVEKEAFSRIGMSVADSAVPAAALRSVAAGL
jgi:hypothetical protein